METTVKGQGLWLEFRSGAWATVYTQPVSLCALAGSSPCTHPSLAPLSPVCPLWPNAMGTAGLYSFLFTSLPLSPIPIQSSVDPAVMGEAHGFQMLKGLVHQEISTFVKLMSFKFFSHPLWLMRLSFPQGLNLGYISERAQVLPAG